MLKCCIVGIVGILTYICMINTALTLKAIKVIEIMCSFELSMNIFIVLPCHIHFDFIAASFFLIAGSGPRLISFTSWLESFRSPA